MDKAPNPYGGDRHAQFTRRSADMSQFIEIERRPYEEPYHLRLVVRASNGSQSGSIVIYSNATDLGEFAAALRGIGSRSSEAVWELGSERSEDNFAFYFRLRAHLVSGTGQCAVEARFNNNRPPPERQISEFSIEALPADLDRLATLLDQFERLEHRKLIWSVTSGDLQQ